MELHINRSRTILNIQKPEIKTNQSYQNQTTSQNLKSRPETLKWRAEMNNYNLKKSSQNMYVKSIHITT